MDASFDTNLLTSVLAGMGALLSLVLISALLLRRDVDRYSNSFLAASLACSLAFLVSIALMNAGTSYHALTAVLAKLWLFSIPLMFVYVKTLTSQGRRATWHYGLYLLPVIILLLVAQQMLHLDDKLMTQEVFAQARGGWPPSGLAIFSALHYATGLSYLGASLIIIKRHKTRMLNKYSYEDKITLRWLAALLTILTVLMAIGLLLAVVRWLPNVDLWPRGIYSTAIVVLVNYLIAFMAISQPRIFTHQNDGSVRDGNKTNALISDSAEEKTKEKPKPKYQTSSLTAEMKAAYWEQLLELMSNDKPHLNNDLHLADLADLLQVPSNHLSQTINQHAQRNFFDFINEYRVSEAKALIERSQLSMTAIFLESGFNSQATFFKQFKRRTGMTPKAYQRKLGK